MDEFKQKPMLGMVARTVALVAGVFVLVLSVLLIADHVRLLQMDPLNDPVLLELREKLAGETGSNDAIVEQIRTYDLYARRMFFSTQAQRRSGGMLLLGGAMLCFVALKLSWLWIPQMPAVRKPDVVDHWELNGLFRQLMAGTGIFLVVISLFLAFVVQSDLATVMQSLPPPTPTDAAPEVAVVEEPAGLPAEFAANWPSLRGPGNYGVAGSSDAPVKWNVESGEGVLWSVELDTRGFNSPIVWGNRLYLSGTNDAGSQVVCFDGDTGKIQWAKTVTSEVEAPDVGEDVGLAAPTMACDGERVFAIFATGDLAAFDLDGNPVWQKNIGVPENPYGMGSSLISDGERLYVQYDHDESQKVMAFDCKTGEQVWETARKHLSWATPALIPTKDGLLLVLNDEQDVTGYDPESGKQLWQVSCLGGEVAPSPAFDGEDVIFVANEYAEATALKLTGETPTILWQYDDYLPEIASPVGTKGFFFITTTVGEIICLDAKTGEVKWEHECDEGFNSSPVLVGDRIYAIDLEGIVHIFKVAEAYEELGTIPMGEPVHATPAIVNGRIYIRSEEHLYCIGQ